MAEVLRGASSKWVTTPPACGHKGRPEREESSWEQEHLKSEQVMGRSRGTGSWVASSFPATEMERWEESVFVFKRSKRKRSLPGRLGDVLVLPLDRPEVEAHFGSLVTFGKSLHF